MDKTKKIIIAFSLLLIIAASVLVATLIKVKQDEEAAGTSTPVYTLQPTASTTIPANTDSWIDINQIAGNLNSTTTVTGTDTSTTTMGVIQIPNGVTQIVYVDQNGNIVNPNDVNNGGENKPTTTKIDNTEAFDKPVDDNEVDEYEINSEGIITAYYGNSTYIMIPEKVQGKQVKGIGANCFKDSKIVFVQIPGSVSTIGKSAFENCSALESVVFMSNTTKTNIDANAFKNCIALKEIYLPAVNVGVTVFDNCTALKRVVFARGSESVGAYCFSNCRSLERVEMPNSITSFGTEVFDGCRQDKLIIATPLGSDAEAYAQNAGFKTAEY